MKNENFRSRYAYLAVGISHETLNTSGVDEDSPSKELYNQLYYNSGPFQRAQAGQMAEYVSESDISE